MINHIVIVDYNMGNLTSIANAIKYIGEKAIIFNKVEDIEKATHLINRKIY